MSGNNNEAPHSLTHMQNMGFDQELQMPMTEMLVFNPTTPGLERQTPIATAEKQDILLTEIKQKTEPADFQMTDIMVLLKQLLQAFIYPPWFDRSANAIRNQVQSGTVTTVTTVTNLTNFGSMSADTTYRVQSINAWAMNCRSLIT